MGQSLGRSTVSYATADAILALAGLASTPLLVRHLGTGPYGILAVVTVLSGQLGVLHFGVGPALTRRVSESRGRGATAELPAIWWAGCSLSLASSLAVGGAFFLLARSAWSGGAFEAAPALVALALGVLVPSTLVVAIGPLFGLSLGYLMGEERHGAVALFRLVHGLLRVGATVGALLAQGGLPGVFWAQATIDALGALLLAAVAGRGHGRPPGLVEVRRALATQVTMGMPFALVGLLFAALNDAEKLAVAVSESVGDLTYYSIPFNVVSRLSLISAGLLSSLIPRVSRLAAAGQPEEAARLCRSVTRFTVAGVGASFCFAAATAPDLLTAWLGPEFAHTSGRVARILLVGSLLGVASQPQSAVLWARTRPRNLVLLQAAEVPLHLLTVYLLVRTWGLAGAAAAWGVRVLVDGAVGRWMASSELGHSTARLVDIWWPVGLLASFTVLLEEVGPLLSPWSRPLTAVPVALLILLRVQAEDWAAVRRLLPARLQR